MNNIDITAGIPSEIKIPDKTSSLFSCPFPIPINVEIYFDSICPAEIKLKKWRSIEDEWEPSIKQTI